MRCEYNLPENPKLPGQLLTAFGKGPDVSEEKFRQSFERWLFETGLFGGFNVFEETETTLSVPEILEQHIHGKGAMCTIQYPEVVAQSGAIEYFIPERFGASFDATVLEEGLWLLNPPFTSKFAEAIDKAAQLSNYHHFFYLSPIINGMDYINFLQVGSWGHVNHFMFESDLIYNGKKYSKAPVSFHMVEAIKGFNLSLD